MRSRFCLIYFDINFDMDFGTDFGMDFGTDFGMDPGIEFGLQAYDEINSARISGERQYKYL